MYYLSEIYNFCYLSKRKEIFLLTELGSYDEDIKPWGMARADLLGNIIFQNKIKPTISYEFVPPKPENTFNFPTHVQSNKKNFAKFNGFNNDKYIINISGYVYDWYDYKINWRETEIRFDVAIFDADNFNELLNKNIIMIWNILKSLIIYLNLLVIKGHFITMKKIIKLSLLIIYLII